MSISAWILIGLTFVVTVVLLPQVAKSRRMMGQSRNNDRFSEGVRVLDVTDTPNADRSVEVAIYRRDNSKSDSNPATRPIKTAQDLRRYTNLKAQRAAATSARANSARLRAILLALLLLAGILVSSFAAFGFLAWWVLTGPVGGVLLTLAWGTVSAKNGRKEDLQFIADIREVERRLEKSPTGRAALISGRNRDNNHWAKVAQESLRNASEGTLSDALLRAKKHTIPELVVQTKSLDQSVQSIEEVARENKTTTQESQNSKLSPKADAETTARPLVDSPRDSKKWELVGIPAPTYTLQSDAQHREVVISAAATDSDWEEAAVPMRPKSARVLPADTALSSEEIQGGTINLQNILDRRRA
ncbi:hypothetical protein [Mobiluncus mulieris]